MISTTALPATSDPTHDRVHSSTARALTLEPRRALLQALRAWAAEHDVDASDLATLDRVFDTLAAAEDGPDLDLVMRAARRRVIEAARAARSVAVD